MVYKYIGRFGKHSALVGSIISVGWITREINFLEAVKNAVL